MGLVGKKEFRRENLKIEGPRRFHELMTFDLVFRHPGIYEPRDSKLGYEKNSRIQEMTNGMTLPRFYNF